MVPDTINREIVIDAPRTTVWAIVTEAQHLSGWLSDEAEIDLRPGGSMRLTWHGHGTYMARIETVERPSKFAFRWRTRKGEPSEVNSTLVVVTLDVEGDGTRLRIIESGFAALPWPEEEQARYLEENAKGWTIELDELRVYAAENAAAGRKR